jgi:hypothetical protein
MPAPIIGTYMGLIRDNNVTITGHNRDIIVIFVRPKKENPADRPPLQEII